MAKYLKINQEFDFSQGFHFFFLSNITQGNQKFIIHPSVFKEKKSTKQCGVSTINSDEINMKSSLKTFLSSLLILILFAGTNETLAQYSSVFQGAKSVGKGNGEFTLQYSNIGFAYDGNSEKYFDNLAFLVGLGVTNLTEIRVRYDRLGYFSEGMEYGLNTLMVGPKFSSESGIFAIYLPVGFAFSEGSGNSWMTNPTLLFSFALGEKLSLNFNPNYAFSFEEGNGIGDGLLGLPIGFGINLGENWVLRPEGGIIFELGYEGNFYTFGLGISGKLGKKE